jgi:uncharacterized protein YbjT (DUF2867 family)
VTGVRGRVGREIASVLATRGVKVRGAARDPAFVSADDIVPTAFDWRDERTWSGAAEGVSAIYLLRPNPERVDGPGADAVSAFLEVAQACDVRTVVFLSEIAAEKRPADSPERRFEQAVTTGPLPWTLLRPNWFMQNLTQPGIDLDEIRDHGTLTMPTGDQPVSWIDARDIAAVATAALLDPERHAGRAFTLTGPEAVTLPELARRIANATGGHVSAAQPALESVLNRYTGSVRDYLERVYATVGSGDAAIVTDDVERVTGQPARTLDDFIAGHAAVWRA